MELSAGRRKRKHSEDFKQSLVDECRRPGVSLAHVATRNELHPNLLRRWVMQRGGFGGEVVSRLAAEPSFVPVTLGSPVRTAEIRIDLELNGTRVTVRWPVSAARDCASWLRGWLK